MLWFKYLELKQRECVSECDITEFRDYTQVSDAFIKVLYTLLKQYFCLSIFHLFRSSL